MRRAGWYLEFLERLDTLEEYLPRRQRQPHGLAGGGVVMPVMLLYRESAVRPPGVEGHGPALVSPDSWRRIDPRVPGGTGSMIVAEIRR